MAVCDVNVLFGERFSNRANSSRCHEKTEDRSERRSNATDTNVVDYGFAGRGRDHDDVMTRAGEVGCEVLQVELNAADAWMVPVADEGDLQARSIRPSPAP